ncbi:unnamed protein product [Dimorphilus gyrociliatus]|uniref:Uncharacterized protein n=1 Tax=Dimorphilus gyrociliatus TaxID=2664684 RepID=A0A7I8VH15_9ANNE|nr:unnamed protein product [Dimorphilus gyrociliatus]
MENETVSNEVEITTIGSFIISKPSNLRKRDFDLSSVLKKHGLDKSFVLNIKNKTESNYIELLTASKRELEKLDDFVANLMNGIKKHEYNTEKKIARFYHNKRLKLIRLLNEVKHINEFSRRCKNKAFQEELSKMADKIKYSIKYTCSKHLTYEKNEVNDLDIGCVSLPDFESPLKSYEICTNDELTSIISSSRGFYGLFATGEILCVNSNDLICSKENSVANILVTSDEQLCYVVKDGNTSVTLTILSSHYHIFESFTIYSDTRPCTFSQFGVFKDVIFLTTKNQVRCYEKNDMVHWVEWSLLDSKPVVLETKDCNAYVASEDYVMIINSIDKTTTTLTSKRCVENISIARDIVGKINDDCVILIMEQIIHVVDPVRETDKTYHMETLFPGEQLRTYRILGKQVIFCLTSKTDRMKLSFRHYPLNPND